MSKAQGFTCDSPSCGKFTTTTTGDAPEGWIRIILPKTGMETIADLSRDICTNKCLEKLARERRRAEAPKSGPRRPSTLDADLVAFLDDKGIQGQQRAAYVTSHKRAHQDIPNPKCPICQYVAEVEA